ncbi:efflux RND transporter periplasmic adaptor subunit [Halomonas getboli]|uniref:efflux RND transporter periplasmic adaptor subunit n=1 Tax=Halomonas getboli TaxID=2935862 RepID=UPI001FFFAAA7|nr:efflux RND transporter periplasmic adaptor subunit [Halomonas getboli]MCK2183748.1 efflux RND transporter periplasmic adaptor subunit [Halomonas getboli]
MNITLQRSRAGLLALTAGLLLSACGQDEAAQSQGGGAETPAQPKPVATMAPQDIPLDKSYPAKLSSDTEVTLVARVSGVLEERLFEPGDIVEKGDSLYAIEPDVYQATVDERKADLASAQAEEARAQRDASRYQRLLNQNSVSRQEADQAQADLNVARASVAQAEAALANARIDLGYTDVTAPVSGAIGLSQVNVGNLVSSGTELATITPLDPLEVRFQLPQRDAFVLRQQLGGQSPETIAATLSLPSVGTTLEGHLEFLGSRVDNDTSTVQAKASFANPDGAVLPGQFVRIQLAGLKRFDVLAVPEIAIGQGLMGPQVFVLDEDDVARARTVELGELAGPWQILTGGVEPGDRVMVGDPAGVEPGTPIEPQPFDGDAQALIAQATGQRQGQASGQAQGAAQGSDSAPAAERASPAEEDAAE